MSHDDSGIPPADREFNELFRAANSNQSGHAPNNSKLNSVKNNPERVSVKHSDFFVESVNRDLICSRDHFFRSETVEVQVDFVGMGDGFRDEIRYNPNNFTWYVNDNSKHLIKIEQFNSIQNPSTWEDGQTGAYRIFIRHVGNNCYEDENAFIHCKFKDDFNETIGASKGYNVELTFKIVCKALAFESDLTYLDNGNINKDTAYDNEIEFPERRSGMNNRSYNTDRAKDNRKLRSALGEDQDIILSTSNIFGQSTLANSLIDSVVVEWEKFDEDTQEWFLVSMNDDTHYSPYTTANQINVGQLEKWYLENHNTSKDTSGRLNLQGLGATGQWRAKITITGDPDNRFTCVIRSNQSQNVFIYERIAPFTLQGQGWECNGVDAILNVNPVIQDRLSHKPGDEINSKTIRYRLYKHTETNVEYVSYIDREDNGETSFFFKIKQDGFYSVQATWITRKSGDKYIWADSGVRSYGTRWSTDRIDTGNDSKDTSTTLGSWYNRAGYLRRTLTPPGGPEEWNMTWNNMTRSDATWNWSHIGTQDASYRSYIVRPYHRDTSRGATGYVQIHDWIEIGDVNSYNVPGLFRPTNSNGGKTDSYLEVKVKITGDLSKIAPGDTSATCLGPVASHNHQPISCVHITPRMPVPILSTRTTLPGLRDPKLVIEWDELNTWDESSQATADLRDTERIVYAHASWKYADESDETVDEHWRNQIEDNWDGSEVFDGLRYAKLSTRFGGGREFTIAGFVYDRAVIVRFKVFAKYIGDDATCYSNATQFIHRTIDPHRVYSYTPGTDLPEKFVKKAHYGNVVVGTPVNPSGGPAKWNSTAFGIGMDNISGIQVSKVHQSATIARFKNGAVGFRRYDTLNNNSYSFTMPKINAHTRAGNSTVRRTDNISRTNTSTYSHQNIPNVPPYTVYVHNSTGVVSRNGKEFLGSKGQGYLRRVTK